MAELTHINEQGRAKMVDVSEKADTKRIGIASGRICMQPETFTLITDGKIKKGDVLAVAQVAGIMAAKKNMGDHSNVPSVITHRCRHSF